MTATSVIIVTHNSQQVLGRCLAALAAQDSPPAEVCIVDAGSRDRGYLAAEQGRAGTTILYRDNVGFARSNNIAFRHLAGNTDYVLFLNPDTLLMPDCLRLAEEYMEADGEAGIVTGRLLGYDFGRQQATGLLDSTGIFRKWYGRWYDRGQGEKDRGQYNVSQTIPAACGALMFCRRQALEDAILSGAGVFDPDFFLYKEDIELCLRLRKTGWSVQYLPLIRAWHGRGWTRRRDVPEELRRAAAASEILLYRKHPSPYMVWAIAKLALVGIFRV